MFGFQEPEGHTVPDWPASLLRNPFAANFALEPLKYDRTRAVRIIGIVRACVLRHAMDCATLPVIIEQQAGTEWKEIPREPRNVTDIWHNGNAEQCGLEVLRDFHAMYKTHGNAYLFAETFKTRTVRELRVLPSHLTEIIPIEGRRIGAYVYNRMGNREAVEPKFVTHWKDFTADDEPIGSSPLESVTFQYETRHDLMRLFQKVVRRGGVGAGFFRVAPDANGNRMTLGDGERKKVEQQLKQRRAQLDIDLILDQLEFERLGLTFAELEFLANCKLADRDICLALGVPPWRVGIEEPGKLTTGTGAGGNAQERIYWTNNRADILIRDAVLTEKLAPLFGVGIRFRTDFSSVLALNEPMLQNATNIAALTGRPVLTVNGVLAMFGQPPSDDPTADDLEAAKAPAGFGAVPGTPAPETKPATVSEQKKRDEGRRLIDTEERRKAWQGKDTLITKYEAKARVIFVELLRAEKRRLLDALEEEGLRAYPMKRDIDLNQVAKPDPEDKRKLQLFYEALLTERGVEAALEVAHQLEIDLNTTAARDFISRRVTLAADGTANARLQAVRMELAREIAEGKTLAQLAEAIGPLYDEFESRIGTVVRTETVSAFNFATAEGWRQTGEVSGMEWLSARDDAVRETHQEADGQIVNAGESFRVGNDLLEYPGDPSGSPEETINCYLPGTLVSGRFVGGVRSKYVGPAVDIITRSGKRLSVTPNHPVLTSQGMVPARLLAQGDYLVADPRTVATLSTRNEQNEPSRIENVFEALRVGRSSRAMHLRGDDLHGDAGFTVGQVDVVAADVELLDKHESAREQGGTNIRFVGEDHALSGEARLRSLGHALGGVGRSPSRAPGRSELTLDGPAIALEPLPFQPLRVGPSSHVDTALVQAAGEHGPREAAGIRQALERLPSLVALDEIIEVRNFQFSGHVYDLQSDTGLMVAQGVVCSNCRCTVLPVLSERARAKRWNHYLDRVLSRATKVAS